MIRYQGTKSALDTNAIIGYQSQLKENDILV